MLYEEEIAVVSYNFELIFRRKIGYVNAKKKWTQFGTLEYNRSDG